MDASDQPARGNLGRSVRASALVPPTMEDRDVLQGAEIRIPRGGVPARNRGSVNTLSHRHEHSGMAAVHDYIDSTDEPFLALFAVPLGTGMDGARDQIITDSPLANGLAHHRRSTRVDRQAGRVFGQKERRTTRNTRTMARVEEADGFNRGLVPS